jgi:hypothetical protein
MRLILSLVIGQPRSLINASNVRHGGSMLGPYESRIFTLRKMREGRAQTDCGRVNAHSQREPIVTNIHYFAQHQCIGS